MSESDKELEKKIKELEEREKEIHEQEKELRVAKKEVEAKLRQAKNASSEDGKGDLEAEIVRLRRLDIFEEKEMGRRLQRKRARQNKKRKDGGRDQTCENRRGRGRK